MNCHDSTNDLSLSKYIDINIHIYIIYIYYSAMLGPWNLFMLVLLAKNSSFSACSSKLSRWQGIQMRRRLHSLKLTFSRLETGRVPYINSCSNHQFSGAMMGYVSSLEVNPSNQTFKKNIPIHTVFVQPTRDALLRELLLFPDFVNK